MPKPLLLIFLFVLAGLPFHLLAQKINNDYRLHIRKAASAVQIYVVIEEEDWLTADVADNFYMLLPIDTSYAEVLTEITMTYDDKNLYLFVTDFHGLPGPYMVESRRRDFSFLKNYNF